MIWQKNQKIYTTDELSRDLKYYMVITLEVPTAISLKVKDSNYWKKKEKGKKKAISSIIKLLGIFSIIKLLVRLGWPPLVVVATSNVYNTYNHAKILFRGVKCAKVFLKCQLENECNS
jgi:hypothetical protein